MANHSKQFKETVLSELMPPLDKLGNSPLWEAIGRRFMNMNYLEADRLSRSNKEFILSLFPSENIYQTLLPIEARNAIGKVGDETKPVKKMLESIGFHYSNEVDPFDGGPHYKSKLKDISVIKSFLSLKKSKIAKELFSDNYILEFNHPSFSFASTKVMAKIENEVLIFNSTKNENIDNFILSFHTLFFS
jgi:arginine N-succinyltransferase